MMKAMIPLAALAASACTTAGAEADTPPMPSGECKAEAAATLVGQAASPELGADALRLTGAKGLRWIRPGDAVTMDYRSDRLNVKLDDSGKVESFNCG
ncbi:I78 family peptidase inhibitor [Allosphingosinicella indica]|uniref:Peptidase inhibitor I78 family protein n=1 Tax=Allosphingosinicella indica TaxID=941907 RepID=A0A1X7H301_9SPHN|nr:I78 family peptidase inhibitor [Allosphingosinicella indica]SMF78895.1 Peptidase inhibitor I78 family protein [Allosphingosinicella indica]